MRHGNETVLLSLLLLFSMVSLSWADYPCRIDTTIQLSYPLTKIQNRIRLREPVFIITVGSSSTAGAMASSYQMTYPEKLRKYLSRYYTRSQISVVNFGKNGTDLITMLADFDVVLQYMPPDLIIWQLGTNDVLQNHILNATVIRQGIQKLQSNQADVMLLDLQYAPVVLAKNGTLEAVKEIAYIGKENNINVFPRFALMEKWHHDLPWPIFLADDMMHLNDWGYDCLAKNMAMAIIDNIERRN